MATKMKGVFKGLKCISHIFEEKEQEICIGFPTDVKHIAHIGWDGSSAIDSTQPSWMKKFKSPTIFQPAPLDPSEDYREDPKIKWVSEDSKRANIKSNYPYNDLSDLPKLSKRHSSTNDNSTESPKKKGKSRRQSRRTKDSSDGSVKSTQHQQDLNQDTSIPSLTDIPKKSLKKKSKESDGDGSSRSRSKDTCSFLDYGPDSCSRLSPIPSID